ncbi:MAG: DUF5360 family protein [Spirosomataceae bacterium]
MKSPALLRPFFWLVDLGFLVYWLITFFKLIPAEYLYKDYSDPLLTDWNWSFFPLDIAISLTGLMSLRLQKQKKAPWRLWALVSLAFTFCSGLQAISFWTLRNDFDWSWWLPNLFLMLYSAYYMYAFLGAKTAQ